jgi:DNA (cytosine-5)-methyltransferase 1
MFSEGKMETLDKFDKPSRTIITSEGGKTPSRVKHLIEQDGKWRRLIPSELEQLNMFPKDFTNYKDVTNNKRAFLMGNALVVGLVEKIGETITSFLK